MSRRDRDDRKRRDRLRSTGHTRHMRKAGPLEYRLPRSRAYRRMSSSPSRLKQIIAALTAVSGLIGVFSVVYSAEAPPRSLLVVPVDSLVDACIDAPNFLTMDVNSIDILDLKIRLCEGSSPSVVKPAPLPNVRVGGIVKADLHSTAKGTVTPIANVDQPIDAYREGSWSWELRPTEPGTFHLSLVITALREDGQGALFRNSRIELPYEVNNTFAYRASKTVGVVVNFLTSLTTILGVTGAAVLAGAIAYFRRRKEQ